MSDEFSVYRITQDQVERLTDVSGRINVMEKSLSSIEGKLERHMISIDEKLERLANAQSNQNTAINKELSDLRGQLQEIKSEYRLWRWGVAFAVGISLVAVFFVMWRV